MSRPPPDPARLGAWRQWLLGMYRRTYFSSLRTSRRLLPLGKIFIAITIVSAFMAWDPSRSAMRHAFVLSWGAIVAGIVLNLARSPRKLSIQRSLPSAFVEGELFDYSILVTNNGRRRSPPLACRDHGRIHFPTAEDWIGSKPPFDLALNGFDRWFGYPKWIWLVETGQDVIGSDVAIPSLAPGASVRIPMRGRAGRRGPREFLGFYCALADPLGLVNRLIPVHERQSILVWPAPRQIALAAPPGSRSVSSGQARDPRRIGNSEEFRSLREWRPGDPIKRVDWKATARFGSPIAREYAPEQNLRSAMILDDSDAGCPLAAFEAAVAFAAFLVDSGRGSAPDLFAIASLAPMDLALPSAIPAAMRSLALAQPGEPASAQAWEDSIASLAAPLSSVILICPTWGPRQHKLAARLAATGISARAIVCSAPSAAIPAGIEAQIEDALS